MKLSLSLANIHEKVLIHFVEFIRFVVNKRTSSISRLFLLSNWKLNLVKDICTKNEAEAAAWARLELGKTCFRGRLAFSVECKE